MKNELNFSYTSAVGKILIEQLDAKQEEIEGVHRSNIFTNKGFMKIRMKCDIDVNQRFAKTDGKAEDENVSVAIRGVK